ncbi:DUF1643 domain-containing protein [Robertkochia marina]|uniref:DUF1643 domain-containing protein n=1 Tax=Robertkochia marina TaxID=1227945 RepID=A0A4S3M247_9FLAO|nr:DUF1643 domain-containing protein [Robertkochia marina]THD67545.1 DUF1643 domain-containing protein [Robertkochia marina]TRZ44587.1 DUF1643 domain-containing protein [Robertkochia marina]
MTSGTWIYERSPSNRFRYALGYPGKNMLGVIGANPSTAAPGHPDRTVTRIEKFSKYWGYDGWVIFNLSPRIATHPNTLPAHLSSTVNKYNLTLIAQVLKQYPIRRLWAAWGDIIEKRAYLYKSCRQISGISECTTLEWLQLQPHTKKGHPRHPLYASSKSTLMSFNISTYSSHLKSGLSSENKPYL